jgi:hypothetical protein
MIFWGLFGTLSHEIVSSFNIFDLPFWEGFLNKIMQGWVVALVLGVTISVLELIYVQNL